MRIITVSREQDISELVHQVFALPTASDERVSHAVQALIQANPHLGGRTIVPLGTPIVIPELADLPPKAVEAVSGGTLDDLRAQADQALTYARSVFEDASKDAAQEAKNSLDVLRSRDFRALADAANLNVKSLADSVNNAAKDAEDQSKVELANLEALRRAVDELVKAISTSTATT
jgi:hypothetical protein